MQYQLIIFLVAASLLLGYIGRAKALGFWGTFLLSLLLSPVAGLLAIGLEDWIASRKAKQEEEVVA